MTYSTISFWLDLQSWTWIPSCEIGLKSSQKEVGYPHNNNGTIAPVGTYCLTGQFCRIKPCLLGNVLDGFSPTGPCMTPSSSILSNWKAGSFQLSSILMALCYATKVCGVFSNRTLSLSYGRQLRTMPIAHIVLEASGVFVTKNS